PIRVGVATVMTHDKPEGQEIAYHKNASPLSGTERGSGAKTRPPSPDGQGVRDKNASPLSGRTGGQGQKRVPPLRNGEGVRGCGRRMGGSSDVTRRANHCATC